MCDPAACRFAATCIPRVPLNVDPRGVRICVCDPDADRLAELMEEHGMDQRTASLTLWAPEMLNKETA